MALPSDHQSGIAASGTGWEGSTYVPVDNWIYPALDRLHALGYVDSAFLGLRPWTRGSVRLMLEEVEEALLTAESVLYLVDATRGVTEEDEKAALRIKVLAAVRRGPLGLFEWSDLIDDAAQDAVPSVLRGGRPRVGTPVMVTHNDPVNRLANGDVGVVVLAPDGRWVVMAGAPAPRRLAPARLGDWEPWWAMTIHKSQGSEFPHAVVSLPTVDSPILTRELLYTAVTRAKDEVTLVGSEEAIRRAVDRPVIRASGLRDRLWPGA